MRILVFQALLLVYQEGHTLCDRFEKARCCLIEMLPGRRRPGKTYPGFIKAQRGLSESSLTMIQDPLRLCHRRVAGALRIVRRALNGRGQRGWRRQGDLRILLAQARQDTYVRHRIKKSRDWPHQKKESPPGLPKIRAATLNERHRAERICAAA
jgi:hypothetical protein